MYEKRASVSQSMTADVIGLLWQIAEQRKIWRSSPGTTSCSWSSSERVEDTLNWVE